MFGDVGELLYVSTCISLTTFLLRQHLQIRIIPRVMQMKKVSAAQTFGY